MKLDYETGNFVGAGEDSAFEILKNITHLKYRSLKHFPYYDGIYRQVPIQWIISQTEFDTLTQSHKNGSIDLYIKLGQRKVAIRIQGKNHGIGLRGIGKAQHDTVQKQILSKYCEVVDVNYIECKELFKDRVNEKAVKELTNAFNTCKVGVPTA